MRRLAALAITIGALLAPGAARAQTGDTTEAAAQPNLFTLTSSDLTGPIPLPAGEGMWRTLAVRNVSNEYRLTIGLTGVGPAGAWVRPAVEQVELAPGQQQIVRMSVNAPSDVVGTHDVAVAATILEAKSILLIGESPMITAERKELQFSVEIVSSGAAAPIDDDRGEADRGAAIETAPELDFARIGFGLLALIGLMGALWIAPRVTRRTAHASVARTAARELVTSRRTPRRAPSGRRAELLGEARRAATNVLAERAARARERAESAAVAAATAQAAAVRARDHSMAELADGRIAAEATRQLAQRVEVDDRTHAARAQAESRALAKQARIELARATARAQLEAARDAEVDRHTFAELSRAAWLQARTEGARSRMTRGPLEHLGPPDGAEPLAIEGSIADRPTPPPPTYDEVSDPVVIERESATAREIDLRAKGSRTKRTRARRDKTEVVALDVEVLNRVLEGRRDRDAFDDRANRLSAR